MPGPGSDLTSWLLDGDPAVRWRVHELYGGPAADVVRERRRVATQGWGARLIAEQDPDGQWAGGLYTPKWTSTTYTLLLLHRLGVPPGDPAFRKGSARLWDGSRVLHGGANIGLRARRAEQCISGLLVLLAAYADQLDDRVDRTVSGLLGQQRSDGGWNCVDLDNPGRHSSFHTSILVLEALLTYERAGGTVQVAGPLTQGREFFLAHRLFRSHRSEQVAVRGSTRFPFPPQWHFDVMRGLEHFVDAGAPPDHRLSDAVEVVRSAQRKDGSWPTYAGYPGRTWFDLEPRGASRINTARALRVLRWWD